MDRRTWLEGRRAAMIKQYDDQASTYDAHPYPADVQGRFVDRLVESCPPGGVILDAPCGTGRYFARIAGAGRRVVGIDQSTGMLEQARARVIAEALHHIGLQALTFEREFDGVMTVDAMEHVFPEDWPLVLVNLRRAVRPGGHLYLTVEEVDVAEIDAAFTALHARGLPAVHGEVVEGETGGYHYYPGRERVRGWLTDARLEIVAEEAQPVDNWGYWHLLLRGDDRESVPGRDAGLAGERVAVAHRAAVRSRSPRRFAVPKKRGILALEADEPDAAHVLGADAAGAKHAGQRGVLSEDAGFSVEDRNDTWGWACRALWGGG